MKSESHSMADCPMMKAATAPDAAAHEHKHWPARPAALVGQASFRVSARIDRWFRKGAAGSTPAAS